MAFSGNNYEHSNEPDEDIFGNRIIILKRIKSLRNLRRSEKELVRLHYLEGTIKGFTLKGIQQYIASKTKIWIEWSCLEYLKRGEEERTKLWFRYMKTDNFAYIGAYRKCIDEIDLLKKEMWKIILDTKAEIYSRIQATKELHSLSKTSVLLLRDLPFVTNLSKFYDENILDSNYKNITPSKTEYLNRNNQEIVEHSLQGKDFDSPENLDNPIDSNGIDGGIASVGENGLSADKSPKKYKCLDDKIFEDMQGQLHITDHLKDKNIDELTEKDLDGIITPQHKESVRRLRELLED